MTDRSADAEKKASKREKVTQKGDPDPKVAAQLYEARQMEEAAAEKAREADKLKAQSAQTAFGTPQMIHSSQPTDVIPGLEPSVKSATVDKDGNVTVSEG